MARECIAQGGHNYRATADANGDYTVSSVLFSIDGRVTCSVCQDEQSVYDVARMVSRDPLHMALAREHVGKVDQGTPARPMSESYALWALESYGVDVARLLPRGLGVEIPHAGMWEHPAPGDMWLTASTSGTFDDVAGAVWTVTARQLARIPLDPRLR
jgi:hypothetical protein